MLVFNPKKAIEIERSAALYEGLKKELFLVEQWTAGVSDISEYTANHMNTWIKYYEEESDELPQLILNFRSYLPKESKWFDIRNNKDFRALAHYHLRGIDGDPCIEQITELLQSYGLIDKDGEEIFSIN